MGIILEKEVALTLKNLQDKRMAGKLLAGIREIRDRGLTASNIKRLGHIKNGYRKRVGRYRILFTAEADRQVIHIWIIEIKKDPRDYYKWIKRIGRNL